MIIESPGYESKSCIHVNKTLLPAELKKTALKYFEAVLILWLALLHYAERFYNRQFITRKKAYHQILERLEKMLDGYFDNNHLILRGLPAPHYVAKELNVSVSYLSRLLKVLTGQTTQQYIHDKLIEKAKEKLSTTDLSISEIAYELGFEHAQAFSRLFKSKTNQSPLGFRQSFN